MDEPCSYLSNAVVCSVNGYDLTVPYQPRRHAGCTDEVVVTVVIVLVLVVSGGDLIIEVMVVVIVLVGLSLPLSLLCVVVVLVILMDPIMASSAASSN